MGGGGGGESSSGILLFSMENGRILLINISKTDKAIEIICATPI